MDQAIEVLKMLNVMGAFGKFLTIFGMAQKAVAFVANTMATAENADKKAAAVTMVSKGLDAMVAAGKIKPDIVENVEDIISDAIELAHGIHKHGPAEISNPFAAVRPNTGG